MLKPWLLLIIFYAAVLTSSCGSGDRDKDGIPDDLDKCPDVYAKTKDGCPIKKEISKIHFYMETSASMGGYFNKDAEFKTIISDLTTKVDKLKPIDIWFVSDTAIQYPKSVESFSHDIATTKPAIQKSSELDRILSQVAEKTKSSEISFLVSDCIMSFSNEAIKKNPEINKTDVYNLKNEIFSTFTELKKRGQAVSIYAFKSKFYGTYYNYQNDRIPLNGVNRPFYIWVIGDKDLLKDFETQLEDISTFKPEKSLHFGLIEEPVTRVNLLTQIEKNGSWIKGDTDGQLVDVVLPTNDSLKFCYALNLESLPAYARENKYLQDHLQLETIGCTASVEVKDKSLISRSKLTGVKQPEIFEKASHFLVFSVASMNLKQASIKVNLPLQYDTWYKDWSVNDDKNIKPGIEEKTFALENLIQGVIEAYETKNKNYIDFSIQLSK